MPKSSRFATVISVSGRSLPVTVITEARLTRTFSITSKQLVLRLPWGVSGDVVHHELQALQTWATQVLEQNPKLWNRFAVKMYQTDDTLTVGKRQYALHIVVEPRNGHSGKLEKEGMIRFYLSDKDTPTGRNKAVKTLLSRIVAQDFHREISQRVLDINQRTFNQPISSVNLKYNRTNWGSCSSNRNINLSTRLLFAPDAVQDYVFVHELAHLVEMNHSDRFWALVSRYMPDYTTHEQWLKQHGHTCDF